MLIQGAYVVVPAGEVWPFSTFPMYSGLRGSEVESVAIRGVAADGVEIGLDKSIYWDPLDNVRLRAAVERALAEDGSEASRLPLLLGVMADRYEALRARGRHGAPRIEGLRIYRVRFDWTKGVSDVRESRERLFDYRHAPARP